MSINFSIDPTVAGSVLGFLSAQGDRDLRGKRLREKARQFDVSTEETREQRGVDNAYREETQQEEHDLNVKTQQDAHSINQQNADTARQAMLATIESNSRMLDEAARVSLTKEQRTRRTELSAQYKIKDENHRRMVRHNESLFMKAYGSMPTEAELSEFTSEDPKLRALAMRASNELLDTGYELDVIEGRLTAYATGREAPEVYKPRVTSLNGRLTVSLFTTDENNAEIVEARKDPRGRSPSLDLYTGMNVYTEGNVGHMSAGRQAQVTADGIQAVLDAQDQAFALPPGDPQAAALVGQADSGLVRIGGQGNIPDENGQTPNDVSFNTALDNPNGVARDGIAEADETVNGGLSQQQDWYGAGIDPLDATQVEDLPAGASRILGGLTFPTAQPQTNALGGQGSAQGVGYAPAATSADQQYLADIRQYGKNLSRYDLELRQGQIEQIKRNRGASDRDMFAQNSAGGHSLSKREQFGFATEYDKDSAAELIKEEYNIDVTDTGHTAQANLSSLVYSTLDAEDGKVYREITQGTPMEGKNYKDLSHRERAYIQNQTIQRISEGLRRKKPGGGVMRRFRNVFSDDIDKGHNPLSNVATVKGAAIPIAKAAVGNPAGFTTASIPPSATDLAGNPVTALPASADVPIAAATPAAATPAAATPAAATPAAATPAAATPAAATPTAPVEPELTLQDRVKLAKASLIDMGALYSPDRVKSAGRGETAAKRKIEAGKRVAAALSNGKDENEQDDTSGAETVAGLIPEMASLGESSAPAATTVEENKWGLRGNRKAKEAKETAGGERASFSDLLKRVGKGLGDGTKGVPESVVKGGIAKRRAQNAKVLAEAKARRARLQQGLKKGQGEQAGATAGWKRISDDRKLQINRS